MKEIHKFVASYLSFLKVAFQSGLLQENLVENAEETLFKINMDNGATLGLIRDEDVY